MKLIDKDALVAEIEKELNTTKKYSTEYVNWATAKKYALRRILSLIDTIEVIDPYEQIVQHSSIKDGIKAHAETYSFNIESELFNQLTPEQQKLWRKEIERACISGGEVGYKLARDPRYKENVETKEVDLEKEIIRVSKNEYFDFTDWKSVARHFFEFGLKAQE